MTKRLILIDNYTGFVFGDVTAADPIAAALEVDADIGEHGRNYEMRARAPQDTTTGYHVYDASGSDLPEVVDGQDKAAIQASERLPFVGYLAVVA